MNKKKIITIILVLLVVLLGGASVYVATQLSTRKSVAPTAPESKPKATGEEWAACPNTVTGVATDVTVCDVITCTPDCPTACGTAASTITTCTDNCGNAATKTCAATEDCAVDGGWSTAWTVCSATACGTTGTKTRTCNNPAPANGGAECTKTDNTLTTPSNRVETAACDAVACPGDGGWSTEWTACSATACGTSGTKTRTCNNPAPETGGEECTRTDETLTTPSNRVETAACDAVNCVLEGSKATYKNVTSNTSGNYSLTTVAETVSKSQIYVYTVELKNASTATATGVAIKDSLADMPVTYMDTVAGCSYSTSNLELTCNTSIKPNETKKFSFRVKASDSVTNGTEIANTANVTFTGGSLDVSKNLAVSTVVGCNHTCTAAEECSTGLTCDTTTSKCRTSTCLTQDDCTCTIAVVPTVTRSAARTATGTIAPTKTVAPTRLATQTETEEVIAEATPTILPETGIFDLPGIAAFGGGLLLAIIGILLAL